MASHELGNVDARPSVEIGSAEVRQRGQEDQHATQPSQRRYRVPVGRTSVKAQRRGHMIDAGETYDSKDLDNGKTFKEERANGMEK